MRLFGLIGKPLTHSFSQTYFSKKFAQENIVDCQYQNFELDQVTLIKDLVQSKPNLKGLNVTIPYKEDVLPFLFQKNAIVSAIGACNCIKIIEGKLYGFNTDVYGFRESIKKLLKPHHTQALILGTGGAAKAVSYALSELNMLSAFVSRKKNGQNVSYQDLDQETMHEYTLIINTTPLGMYPKVDSYPEIPYEFINDRHLLYDLTYNPERTAFLMKGAANGATIKNGYEMLFLQAEESWRIWNS